jgi:hypothetical protein
MTTNAPSRRLTPDRIAIAVVLGGSLAVALVYLVLGALGAVRMLIDPVVRLTIGADAPIGTIAGSAVDGSWDTARIAFTDLAGGARALLSAGGLLTALTTVAIALGVAWLCRTLLRGNAPFTRSLTRLARFVALALIIGPTIGRFLTDLGTNTAVVDAGLHDPLTIGFGFDPAPWVAGIVIAIVAELFLRGERLQRDTEGLV